MLSIGTIDTARSLYTSGHRAQALDLLQDTVTLGESSQLSLGGTWKAIAALVTGQGAAPITSAGKGHPKPPGGGKGHPKPK